MSENKFPDGWDQQRVRRTIEHYERQTEDEAVAEDDAAMAPAETLMSIPRELIPAVRELIAKRKAS